MEENQPPKALNEADLELLGRLAKYTNGYDQTLLKSVKDLNTNMVAYNSRICEVLERVLHVSESTKMSKSTSP